MYCRLLPSRRAISACVRPRRSSLLHEQRQLQRPQRLALLVLDHLVVAVGGLVDERRNLAAARRASTPAAAARRSSASSARPLRGAAAPRSAVARRAARSSRRVPAATRRRTRGAAARGLRRCVDRQHAAARRWPRSRRRAVQRRRDHQAAAAWLSSGDCAAVTMLGDARSARLDLGQASRAAVFFISHSTAPSACASAIAERFGMRGEVAQARRRCGSSASGSAGPPATKLAFWNGVGSTSVGSSPISVQLRVQHRLDLAQADPLVVQQRASRRRSPPG